MLNPVSLDTLCASLAKAAGVDTPACAAASNQLLDAYVTEVFSGAKADRLFMYNPDAIAQWIANKYAFLLKHVYEETELSVPFQTVMPSVTPVCFGTMYTGAQPEVHGIRKYEKPIITIDSLFDAMIRAGKKCCIVAETNCSLSKIYLNREMDYFIYDTIAQVNAKGAQLILEDQYDFVLIYNGNYDSLMHKFGPESREALAELKANAEAFATFMSMIRTHWTGHNTLCGFAMDHGCHEIDGNCGAHGLDMPEDLNIEHRYVAIPGKA